MIHPSDLAKLQALYSSGDSQRQIIDEEAQALDLTPEQTNTIFDIGGVPEEAPPEKPKPDKGRWVKNGAGFFHWVTQK